MNLAKAFPLVIALTVGRHAGTYPVHFQFPDDRQRAERDVSAISGLLDPLSKDFSHSQPLQLRLGLLHAIGFNLDIPDSGDKAVAPNDPQANYQYGAFLAATTKKGEGMPFLEKGQKSWCSQRGLLAGIELRLGRRESQSDRES
jgi:hypothetical protein